MPNDNSIIDNLVAGGVIGAALGAIISKDKGEGATIGAIAGAAIVATFKANEAAKKTNLPLIYEENGIIFREFKGKRTILKRLKKPVIKPKNTFKIK